MIVQLACDFKIIFTSPTNLKSLRQIADCRIRETTLRTPILVTTSNVRFDAERGSYTIHCIQVILTKVHCVETGAKALKGETEYIKTKLFEGVDYERNITGKGKLIQIYDPKADMNSPPYWEHEDELVFGSHDVPAGYKVRVVAATVKFT
ncbi:hypothetical protein H2198_010969 [Neophaeococcomyces mojaviensis]|uniref:Uncharacterized protein n=1 Tax=Neophaeococcomyces mojaviensis TaxID=3383035 RepID=A0ACC2ZM39_9EURO|nr:hypothetical protein H2198_010969 [Knufia sp. JES_112]